MSDSHLMFTINKEKAHVPVSPARRLYLEEVIITEQPDGKTLVDFKVRDSGNVVRVMTMPARVALVLADLVKKIDTQNPSAGPDEIEGQSVAG